MASRVRPSPINTMNTHIIPVRFEYFAPKTLNEAVDLLSRFRGRAKVLAGGTDLVVQMKVGRVRPEYVVSIRWLRELDFIDTREDGLHIGALTKLRRIEKSDVIRRGFIALYEAAKAMGGVQVRCMGTVGGNLCNASPAADTAPPLMVYEARVKAVSTRGEREIPITKFFKGPRETELMRDEILTEVIIPYIDGAGTATLKLGRRNAFTLSVVAVSTLAKVSNGRFEDVRIALNAVAPRPVRAVRAEEFLRGREVCMEVIDEGSKLVVKDISPVSDVRATAEYRRDMSVVLTHDALLKSLRRAGFAIGGE